MRVPLLSVENLNVAFPSELGVVRAVRGLSFAVEPGEVLGLVGESGAGKSVTALALMGLLPSGTVVEGSVRLRGRELLGAEHRAQAGFRGREMAMVFQDPTTALNPVRSIGWHLAEAVRAHHDVSKREALARALDLLELVGIPEPGDGSAATPTSSREG